MVQLGSETGWKDVVEIGRLEKPLTTEMNRRAEGESEPQRIFTS